MSDKKPEDIPTGSVTRRKVIKGMVAVCVASGADVVNGAPATTQAEPIASDDLAAADRVIGRSFSDKQNKQMTGILSGRRKRFVEMRQIAIDPDTDPAWLFDPRLPDTKVPTGEATLK